MKQILLKRLNSFRQAGKGLSFALRTQPNFRIQMVAAVMVAGLGIWLSITPIEWILVALSIGLVLAAELFNTAIEQLLDKLHPQYDPSIGRAKDLAAGAVLMAAIAAAAIGLAIFVPKVAQTIGACGCF